MGPGGGYVLSEHTLSREAVLNFLFPKEKIDVRPNELHETENKQIYLHLQTLDAVCVQLFPSFVIFLLTSLL